MELTPQEIAGLRVSPWEPGRCKSTGRVIRAMHPARLVVEAELPDTEEPFRCFMGSGHPAPCCAWGPDGAPWILNPRGA